MLRKSIIALTFVAMSACFTSCKKEDAIRELETTHYEKSTCCGEDGTLPDKPDDGKGNEEGE